MILEKDTFEMFGYYPNRLNPQAHKKIIVKCDKCNEIRIIEYRSYKNLCSSCSRKGNIPWNKGVSAEDDERVKLNCEAMHKARRGKPAWNEKKKLSKEHIKNLRESHKGQHSSPNTEFKRNHIPSNKGESPSDKTKEKISNALKKHFSNPTNHWNWQGGKSYEPYCIKFNNQFKEKIRNQFNRKCFICGKSEIENGRRLDVHHVDYNKDCLCDNSKCSFIPLCISCHSKTNSNREYWEEYLQSKLLEFNRG